MCRGSEAREGDESGAINTNAATSPLSCTSVCVCENKTKYVWWGSGKEKKAHNWIINNNRNRANGNDSMTKAKPPPQQKKKCWNEENMCHCLYTMWFANVQALTHTDEANQITVVVRAGALLGRVARVLDRDEEEQTTERVRERQSSANRISADFWSRPWTLH